MTTAPLKDILRNLTPEQQSFAMAIAIILDRIRRLPKEDSDDLFELIQHHRNAETEEQEIAADEAILELIAQEPVSVHEMDLEADNHFADLDKWREFVSRQIREHRTTAGLTQEQLASKTGLPQSHISRIEHARHSPSQITLQKIAEALNIPLSKLDPNL